MKRTSYILITSLVISSIADAKLTYSGRDVQKALTEAAGATGVPVRLLTAICKIESDLKPNAVNMLEPKGGPARGICQLQVGTAEMMGFKSTVTIYEEHFTKHGKRIVRVRTLDRTADLYNPYLNAYYAAKYIKKHLDKYGGDWVLAISAYNAGRAIRGNRDYVRKVLHIAGGL